MIRSHTYLDFFPYPTFRMKQQEIIEQIENAARLRKNILLSAPNGTGKTIIVLSALIPVALEQKLKIVYMCRTHAQSDRVIKELKKIYNSSSLKSSKVSGISIRGRGEMCLHHKLLGSKMNPIEAMSICKTLRSEKDCTHYRNLENITEGFKESESVSFSYPVNGEELIKFCKEKRYCPYFLSKLLLKEVSIIVCNFQWLFNLDIKYRFLKLAGVDLGKCILIIDECHNIIELSCDVNSYKLVPYSLTACQNEMFAFGFPEIYSTFVAYLKNHLIRKKGQLKLGDTELNARSVLKNICVKLKLKSITEFRKFLMQLRAEYNDRIESSQDSSTQNIDSLVKFWLSWIKKYNSEKYYFCYNVSKGPSRTYIALEIVALDPRDITLSLFRNCYMSLNLSGTVNPQVFNHLTGLNWKKGGFLSINSPSPFKKNNILALITEGINTKNENRVPEMYIKIIAKIKEVLENTPANIGIFCASYKILNDLRMNGILTMVKQTGKRLFIESPKNSASDNAHILSQFKLASKHNGGVLLGVAGGRNSEGEDYPGDLMNAVIIIGIPYQYPTSRNQAKINYYNKAFNGQGWVFAYLYPAMQRANQASGRPIRKENDKGAIVFMDSRFIDKKGWISEWLRNEIQILPDRKNLISKVLNRFWNR